MKVMGFYVLRSVTLGISASSPIRLPEPDSDEADEISKEYARFVESVTNGNSFQVTGLYAEGKLALPVVQQPHGDLLFVSPTMVATQFNLGSIGLKDDVALLAEATFTGPKIHSIKNADELHLINGDGSIRKYIVNTIRRFWSFMPFDPGSELVELNLHDERIGESYTADKLFREMYIDSDSLDDELTIQTCELDDRQIPVIRRFIRAHKVENGKV